MSAEVRKLTDDAPVVHWKPTFTTGGGVPASAMRLISFGPCTSGGTGHIVSVGGITKPARVADNPHKPGTPDHREWEHANVHNPRAWGDSEERRAATATADARLAALKESVLAARTPAQVATEAILAEVRDATKKPEPATGHTWTRSGSTITLHFNGIDLSDSVKSFALSADALALDTANYSFKLPRASDQLRERYVVMSSARPPSTEPRRPH